MTNAPAYEIAVALQITVFAVGRAEDFGVGHGNGRFFRHDQFCDKNPSYHKRVVFIDRSPAECYNSFRVLWIGEKSLP